MSNELREKLALRVENLKARGVTPGLAVILVGEDPASQIYVKNKGLGCAQVGMHSVTIRLPETTTQQELETQIDQLNTTRPSTAFWCSCLCPQDWTRRRL